MVAIPDPTGDVEEMSLDGIFADWTIISKEGKKFPCHRFILATKSSVMKAMFSMGLVSLIMVSGVMVAASFGIKYFIGLTEISKSSSYGDKKKE